MAWAYWSGENLLKPFTEYTPLSFLANAVVWSSSLELYCAVGAAISGGDNCATSPDGINWTYGNIGQDNPWGSITWSDSLGLFCIVSRLGTNRVATSSNGINWTLQSASVNVNWNDITWSEDLGLFVACRDAGASNNIRFMRSSNGSSWTSTTLNDPNFVSFANTSIVWNDNLSMFVSVGSINDKQITYSYDGIDWTLTSNPGNTQRISIIPHPKGFLSGCQSGTSGERHSISFDGISWSNVNFSGRSTMSGCYAKKSKVLVTFPRGSNLIFITKNLNTYKNFQSFTTNSAFSTVAGQKSSTYSEKLDRVVFVSHNNLLVNNI
jgi:hypothetical protein